MMGEAFMEGAECKDRAVLLVKRIYCDQRLTRAEAARLLAEIAEEAVSRIEAIGDHPGADE